MPSYPGELSVCILAELDTDADNKLVNTHNYSNKNHNIMKPLVKSNIYFEATVTTTHN